MIADKYTYKIIGTQGPSMQPTLDDTNTLVVLDCFTTKFIRNPKVGEIVMAQNAFKPGALVVKRVLYTEGQTAEFYSYKEQCTLKVEVPEGHVWIEGDNKKNSKDSRDFGPIGLSLIDGIVRYKVWPYDQIT